jgi:hypothetical protein
LVIWKREDGKWQNGKGCEALRPEMGDMRYEMGDMRWEKVSKK